MHPRIEELLTYLDRRREEVRAAVDNVPARDRDVQIDGRWSVANVIEHLAIVETGIAGLFRHRIGAAVAEGLGQDRDTTSVFTAYPVAGVADRTRRIESPTAVRPTSEVDANSAWKNLEDSRVKLREAVLSGDGLALAELSHPHRAFGPLNLYQWLVFTADHEARHAEQIREIGDELARRAS